LAESRKKVAKQLTVVQFQKICISGPQGWSSEIPAKFSLSRISRGGGVAVKTKQKKFHGVWTFSGT